MCPTVIADSDDESDILVDESRSRPSPQSVPAAATQALTRSSDQASLATASTDPAFFQNVYNDQNDAACGRAGALQLPDSKRQDDHQSSAVTVPQVSFHRTTTGFYNSSMTSSMTEPNIDRYQDIFPDGDPGEWKRTSRQTRGQGQCTIPSTTDPWDVPSSPEDPQASGKPPRGHRIRNVASLSGQGQACETANCSAPAAATAAITSTERNGQDGIDKRGAKRRRLREPLPSSRAIDDVNLVTLLSSNDINHHILPLINATEIPSISPSVLPSKSHSPPLADPPCRESIVGSLSRGNTKNNNLLLQQQTLYAAKSSGAETSINTPRSCIFSSRHQDPLGASEVDGESVSETRKRRRLCPGQGLDLSPDVISVGEPGAALIKTSRRKPRDESGDEPGDDPHGEYCDEIGDEPGNESSHREIEADPPERPPSLLQLDDQDCQPVTVQDVADKPKKRRGRPRKNKETDQLGLTEQKTGISESLPGIYAPPIAETSKKKRGRPKKQPLPVVADQTLPPAGDVSAIDATVAAVGDDVDIRFMSGHDSPAESKKAVEMLTRDDLAPLGPTPTREEKAANDSMKSASPSPAAAKPVFRVGLSKRWKIAPLLKSVRK